MIRVGDRVQVHVPPTTQIPNNPVSRFNGTEFVVRNVKISYYNKAPKRQYILYGCESQYGTPFWFTDEDLVKVGDEE